MPVTQVESGLAKIGDAQIYYEIAGEGQSFVMIHAGVADSRQWNNEFAYFSENYRVLRYDMRGYGKSDPVAGGFSHLQDLAALLDYTDMALPAILMGCSMGGGLALDFALTQPSTVKALIMVGSGPSGLELDMPEPAKFAEAEEAYNAGDLDLLAELETQIWFDGTGRSPGQVNQQMRRLAYQMNHVALSHDAKSLGERLPDTKTPAAERLGELDVPVLVVVGEHDIPYILAAADYMVANIRSARMVVLEDAAHLSNMDHPDRFQQVLRSFLDEISR